MTPNPTREAAARLEIAAEGYDHAADALDASWKKQFPDGIPRAQGYREHAADLRTVLIALSEAQEALSAYRVKIAEIIDPNYFAKYSTAPKTGHWVFNDSYGERGRAEALAKADAILALRERLANA